MKNYIKYILKNKFKLIWIIFINLIIIGLISQIIKYSDKLIASELIFLITFISLIYIVAMYHPYKEYKDGLKNK